MTGPWIRANSNGYKTLTNGNNIHRVYDNGDGTVDVYFDEDYHIKLDISFENIMRALTNE